MNRRSFAGKLAAGLVVASLAGSAAAQAPRVHLNIMPSHALAYSSHSESGHTLLLVSGIVLLIGLANDNSTLTTLGGVGVLVYLVEYEPNHFRYQPWLRHDVAKSGPVSFGFATNRDAGLIHPRPFAQWSTKF